MLRTNGFSGDQFTNNWFSVINISVNSISFISKTLQMAANVSANVCGNVCGGKIVCLSCCLGRCMPRSRRIKTCKFGVKTC